MERPTETEGMDGKRRGRGRRKMWCGKRGGEGGGEVGGQREEKGGRRRGGGKKRRREREWCACLGAKSWASRAQAWPRLTLERSRSEVIIEHEPPSGSQPPLGVANAGIKLPH
ncbi:hypothetical protein HZU73_00227 [Apis mellifera caucasica]|nr:hypothetical protein HZU73_00227 [Apis mellifera caucasica]